MTQNQFNALCNEHGIAPSIALENDELIEELHLKTEIKKRTLQETFNNLKKKNKKSEPKQKVIRIDGKGEAGKKGAKAGNLFIRIFVKKHNIFERRGDDLFTFVDLNFSQAALGDKIEMKSLEATNILLEVPAGTETGKVLRISGKGVPHFGGYGRGNLYVELKIKTPKKLTREQRKILEQLKEEGL